MGGNACSCDDDDIMGHKEHFCEMTLLLQMMSVIMCCIVIVFLLLLTVVGLAIFLPKQILLSNGH